jgi:pimeloyl-ACP methyl ester carboxylesterase
MPTTERAHATLHYELHEAAGRDAPAVVFAHGAGGNSLVWWQQVPHFACTHRVLVFDHRGFGRSRCAPEHFHAREFAEDLRTILDHAGIERAALVCQSMGGWSGLPFALAWPDRVSALVLSGTPAGVLTPKVREAFAAIGRATATEGIRGNRALAAHFPQRAPELAFLYDRIGALNPGLPPQALGSIGATEVDCAALARHRVPTLMCAGAHDGLFPPAALHEAAAAIPGCRVVDFPDSGHSPYFEDAARFNAVVGGFLARA